jgi:hypothetical protein
MDKRKLIKNTNDFIIGVALLALGIYVLFTNDIIQGNLPTAVIVSPLVRPDVYVRLIGGCLAFCAAILIIKSINFSRTADVKGFHFAITREAVLTVVSLIIYTAVLPRIGFAVSTFLLVFFQTCMYTHKEKSSERKPPVPRKDIIRDLLIALVYSALLVVLLDLIFSRVLYVNLP